MVKDTQPIKHFSNGLGKKVKPICGSKTWLKTGELAVEGLGAEKATTCVECLLKLKK